jgi:hypothetical protein
LCIEAKSCEDAIFATSIFDEFEEIQIFDEFFDFSGIFQFVTNLRESKFGIYKIP